MFNPHMEERYKTCENVKKAGLGLCVGGIFGMGESIEDRDSLIDSIISLKPESIPLNFYIPNPALPIKNRNISTKEAINIIKKSRKLLGEDGLLMVAGGREHLFNGIEDKMFEAGANSIVIGDYLTTKGNSISKDIIMMNKIGYEVAIKSVNGIVYVSHILLSIQSY